MEHQAANDLTGLAAVALAALICGIFLERLRQPAIVGYILAGVVLGPAGFHLVGEASVAPLAELGVLLLLFTIGMELSVRAFRRMWRLFVVTTLFQVVGSTAMTFALSLLFGWPPGLAIFLGFAVALSSTAVAVKILERLGELRTRVGRVTIGVLIAQDLAVVPMMLTLSAMAGDSFQWSALPKIAFSILFLVWLIWFLSRGRKIFLPYSAMVGGHRDLTPLAALAFCLGAAAVSGLMGLSAAYGAFLAGLVIGNSHQRHAMLAVVEPLQSILMMVFFLSIGLLVDLDYLWENLGAVLLLLTMVTIFKTVLNVAILHLLGEPWQRAFLVGVTIAQIGEFSFLLAVVGLDSGLITPEDRRLIVAVTVLSLALSPLWVVIGRRLHDLADDGITSGQRLIQLVYAPEAEFVLGTLGEARSLTMRQARTLAIILRRKLLWRLRGKPENLAVKPPPVEDLHSKIALATDVRMDVSGEAMPVAISAVNLAPSEGPDPSTMERQPFRKPSRRRRSTAAVVTGARTGILSPDKPTKTGRPQRPKKPGKKNS